MNPEWTEEDKILYLKIKDGIQKGSIIFKELNSYNSILETRGNE